MFKLSSHFIRGLLKRQCHRVQGRGKGLTRSLLLGLPRNVSVLPVNMASYPAWLYRLLDEYSTEKYRIEYDSSGSALFNHLAHGVIALGRLGANESRVQQFIDHYVTKLNVPGPDDVTDDVTDTKKLLGKHTRYNKLVEHYKARLEHCKGDLGVLIQEELPKLSPGLANSALHGFIHLGYGWSVNSVQIVLEGLAYLHFAYVPLGLVDDYPGPDLRTLGQGSEDILTVLGRVRANTTLRDTVMAESQDPLKNRQSTGFQNKAGAMLDYHATEAVDYVHSIKFPEFWDPNKVDTEQVNRICEWILDCAITVYVKSRRKNDFFFIHGITGAWSLYKLLPLLHNEMDILKTLRVFLATFVAVYVARNIPELDSDEEVTTEMSELVKEAMAVERDEHIYKLVQVCVERSQENAGLKELYTKACGVSLKYDLLIRA